MAQVLPPGFDYHCGFLAGEEADLFFAELRRQIAWQNETLVIFGKPREVPRLVAWYGDAGATYRYSGVQHDPLPWVPSLRALRERCQIVSGKRFSSVLANLYRTGADSMGWHSDDEPVLGPTPMIASISLGATRRFRIRRRQDHACYDLDLEHGSLLLMSGNSQRDYQHGVPKTAKPVAERINLTFRMIEVSDVKRSEG